MNKAIPQRAAGRINGGGLLHRPIIGGVFGAGAYSLATQATIEAGLHAVRFFVIDLHTGNVLSSGDSKLEVLEGARHALRVTAPAANDEAWLQSSLFPPKETPLREPADRPVSRRRRDVFERSGGRCCYCRLPLRLGGCWHIEHQLPRALGGGDAPINLVAACEACNLAKGDRTALEFVARSA